MANVSSLKPAPVSSDAALAAVDAAVRRLDAALPGGWACPPQGGTAPFGYKLGPPSGKSRPPVLVPDPAQQAAIKTIVRLCGEGLTLHRIKSSMLTVHGIRLSHQTVANILARERPAVAA
jgi:hypothetical protein